MCVVLKLRGDSEPILNSESCDVMTSVGFPLISSYNHTFIMKWHEYKIVESFCSKHLHAWLSLFFLLRPEILFVQNPNSISFTTLENYNPGHDSLDPDNVALLTQPVCA